MTDLTNKQRAELIAWAKRALHGLAESHTYVGILSTHPMTETRIEFILQLGHAILLDKLIVIPVPYGQPVPKKLEAVADRIVRYDANDPKTLEQNLVIALTELGVNPQ